MLTFDSSISASLTRDVKSGPYFFSVESGTDVQLDFIVDVPADPRYGTAASSYTVSVSLGGGSTIDAGQMVQIPLPTGKIVASAPGAFVANLQHYASRGHSASTG